MKSLNDFVYERQMGGDWIREKTDKFDCRILAFDEPSQYGIDGGKISKLWIKDLSTNKQVVNYDRGWDDKVDDSNKELKTFYDKIIKKYN